MFIAPTPHKMIHLRRSDMSRFKKHRSLNNITLLRSSANILIRLVYKHLVPNGTENALCRYAALPILRRLFRIFEFFLPPPVSTLLDHLPRRREIFLRTLPRIRLHRMKKARAVEMNVSHE